MQLAKIFSFLLTLSKPHQQGMRLKLSITLCALLLIASADVLAITNSLSDMNRYCHIPVFVQGGGKVRPNIMLFVDNSQSMMLEAYLTSNPVYGNTQQYVGLFDSERCYSYDAVAQRFVVGDWVKQPPSWGWTTPNFACWDSSASQYSGNFLNYLTMSRFEVAKKVLVGGRWTSTTQEIRGETTAWMFPSNGQQEHKLNINPKDYTDLPSCLKMEFKRGSSNGSTPGDEFTIIGVSCTAGGGSSGPSSVFNQRLFATDPDANATQDSDQDGLRNNPNDKTAGTACKGDLPDTDNDGWIDGFEHARGWTCNNGNSPAAGSFASDTDGDGLPDILETNSTGAFSTTQPWLRCSPTLTDTDGDGYNDTDEVNAKTDCKNAASKPGGGGTSTITKTFKLRIYSPSEPQGVLHTLNEDDARWGLASFRTQMSPVQQEGAKIDAPLGSSVTAVVIPKLRALVAPQSKADNDDTPIGEALYELLRWHQQQLPYYSGYPASTLGLNLLDPASWPSFDYLINDPLPLNTPYSALSNKVKQWDPWFEWEQRNGVAQQYVPCRKSNILVISDGKSSHDGDVPSISGVNLSNWDQDEHVNGPTKKPNNAGLVWYPSYDYPQKQFWPPPNHPNWLDPNAGGTANYSDSLDDIALYGNVGGAKPGQPAGDFRAGVWEPLLPGNQSVQSWFVYAFGDTSGTNSQNNEAGKPWLMFNAGIMGAFIDSNGNSIPDLKAEWDADGDDEPDGFFNAEDAALLETAIIKAINAILNRSATGAAASIAVNSSEGEAGVVQTFFDPLIQYGSDILTWAGQLRLLWFDRFAVLREDRTPPSLNRGDQTLTLTIDRPVRYQFDLASQSTIAKYYSDSDGNGVIDQDTDADGIIDAPSIATSSIRDVPAMADAGRYLFENPYWTRTIYTHARSHRDVPNDPLGYIRAGNGVPTGVPYLGNKICHDFADADGFSNYTQLPLATWESFELCNYYVAGDDYAVSWYGWRNRTASIAGSPLNTWKLGDIVYSTPAIVGPPSNSRYKDFDPTYARLMSNYTERPQILYVGSNAGMLHAFHIGIFKNGDDKNKQVNGSDPGSTSQIDEAYMQPAIDTLPGLSHSTYYSPGEELWSFIPYNAWPHIQWLRLPEYKDCHVFYVDLSPVAVDARIYNKNLPANDPHPHGWATLLAGGTRIGCRSPASAGDFGPYSIPGPAIEGVSTQEPFGPAYFIMDISRPEYPNLLWEWVAPEGTYATIIPQIFRVGDPSDSQCLTNNCAWFVAYGTGPNGAFGSGNAFHYSSNKTTNKLYFVRLDTGLHNGGSAFHDPSNMKVKSFSIPLVAGQGEYVVDIAPADGINHDLNNQDFSVDNLYIATTIYKSATDYDGRILRVATNNSINPDTWDIKELYYSPSPFSTMLRLYTTNNVDHTKTRNIIITGTGRFYDPDDRDYNEQQSLLFIRDDCSHGVGKPECSASDYNTPLTKNDLINVTNCLINDATACDDSVAASLGPKTLGELITVPNNVYKGWYWDLQEPGERIVTRPISQGRIIGFTSFIPGAAGPCGATDPGRSKLYFVREESGFLYGEFEAGAGIVSPGVIGDKIIAAGSQGELSVMENPFVITPLKGFKEVRKLAAVSN